MTTEHFEPIHKPTEALKPTEDLYQPEQQAPVDKDSASTVINSSEANLEREKEGVAASSAEVDNSQNHFKVSTEKNELDEVGEEEFEDNLEPDSDDDCPEFEGGEPRGRLYPPVAGQGPGPKPGRPYQPK